MNLVVPIKPQDNLQERLLETLDKARALVVSGEITGLILITEKQKMYSRSIVNIMPPEAAMILGRVWYHAQREWDTL